MKEKYQKYKKFLRGLKASIRLFPYSAYLLNFFPFYTMLIQAKLINSLWDFIFPIPFIFVMATGFAYNTICDIKIDPEEKNPIKRGDISHRSVFLVMLFSLIASIILFTFCSNSPFTIFLFFVYILLWLAYSGLNIRFKESYLGPFVASIVLWTGGPLILLVEYNYINLMSLTLLFGIFLIFTSREIRHTILDYKNDLNGGSQTFIVRSGLKWAIMSQYVLLISGAVFISLSLYASMEKVLDSVFGTTVIQISILSYLILVLLSYLPFKIMKYQSYAPYYLTKILLIIYGCVMLNLSPIYTLLLIWVFISDKFP